jgi:hypothetical protein
MTPVGEVPPGNDVSRGLSVSSAASRTGGGSRHRQSSFAEALDEKDEAGEHAGNH